MSRRRTRDPRLDDPADRGFLLLSRHPTEGFNFYINNQRVARVIVDRVDGQRVKLAIKADPSVVILRDEIDPGMAGGGAA